MVLHLQNRSALLIELFVVESENIWQKKFDNIFKNTQKTKIFILIYHFFQVSYHLRAAYKIHCGFGFLFNAAVKDRPREGRCTLYFNNSGVSTEICSDITMGI